MSKLVIATGAGSKVFSKLGIDAKSWKEVDVKEAVGNEVIILNFGAPTSNAGNFSAACSGIYEQISFIEKISTKAAFVRVLHVRSCAELKVRFRNGQRCFDWNAEVQISKNELLENPYAYWKKFQYLYFKDKMITSNNFDVSMLLIPFVDFQSVQHNREYYAPNSKILFDPCAKFDVVEIRKLKESVLSFIASGKLKHPIFDQKTINQLCNIQEQKLVTNNFRQILTSQLFRIMRPSLADRSRRIADKLLPPGRVLK